MALCRPPHLGVHPIALDRDFARARVGALPLLAEPGSPVGELRLALSGLVDAHGEVSLDVVDPGELAAQRLHALRGGRQVHAAPGRLRDQLRFPRLRGLDRLSEPCHLRLVGRLGLARERNALLELAECRHGFGALLRDLACLHLDRLAVPVDPLVLPRRLLEVHSPVGPANSSTWALR